MQSISPQNLKTLIENNQVALIDVRESFEHNAEKITESISKPMSTFDIKSLNDYKEKKIVFYCKSGRRSSTIYNKVTKSDHYDKDIFYNLDGGIEEWKRAGYEVVKSVKKILPLDQQTHLAIGILIFLFSYLTIAFSKLFIIGICFIGSGLIVAGLTGFCGLGMLLSKMPWNKGNTKNSSCAVRQ